MENVSILLPIKPKYCKKILTQEKKYEYRKKLPKKKISKIYLYATSPVKKVVGEATVLSIKTAEKFNLWEQTFNFSGITQAEYNDYFRNVSTASCYVLDTIKEYAVPKNLSDFGINFYPQSYVYIKEQKPSSNQ